MGKTKNCARNVVQEMMSKKCLKIGFCLKRKLCVKNETLSRNEILPKNNNFV